MIGDPPPDEHERQLRELAGAIVGQIGAYFEYRVAEDRIGSGRAEQAKREAIDSLVRLGRLMADAARVR